MSGTSDTVGADAVIGDGAAWERRFERVVAWVPYATLAIGTVLGMLDPDPDGAERGVTLGLVALATAWVYVMYTRAQRRGRVGPVRAAVYFAGLLLLGVLLIGAQPAFFVFPITGFFHAYLLRPPALVFVGVLLTSLVVNMLIVLSGLTSEALWTYGIVVAIQTAAIGLGILGGERISELSEQRRQALVDLRRAHDENAALQERLVAQARQAGVDTERRRLAREIHDTIAQGLIGVVTQLEAAGQVKGDPVELQRRLDNAAALARESLTEARRSVQALIPEQLDGHELPAALVEVVAGWSAVNGVAAETSTTGTTQVLHPEVEITLLRAAQEALANVARHASATRVGVTLSYMGDVVTLDVRDDGKGFDPAVGTAGFGLTAMRQRVEAMAGEMAVESAPGEGTAVSVAVPALSRQGTAADG